MKIRTFFETKTFFFTPDFVELREEVLCFLVHTLEFKALKFLCPPKMCFPQSRYPGAGRACAVCSPGK